MARRFFCTIFAQDREQLLALSKYDVDIFPPTAHVTDQKEHAVEGLLTLEEVEKLVDSGYRILVEEDAAKRSRAAEFVMSAEEWIAEFEKRERK
jgi:hypothetical protein